MANLLEYTLSLRDQMSEHMRRIGAGADATANSVQNLQTNVGRIESSYGGARKSIAQLRDQLQRLEKFRDTSTTRNADVMRQYRIEIERTSSELHRLENQHAGSSAFGRMFKDMVSSIPFAGLLTNPLVLAGGLAAKSIKLGIEQDLQNTSFKVLLGSEDAAKKMVDDIAKYGKATPYDKIGVGENAKTMLSFGIDEAKIMPTLQAIGDIAMGDANKMSSLTLAFSQMSSTGKLMGQDLLQMINAGFNPLNEISKKTGKSIGDLKKDMEKGLITTKMVEEAYLSATAEGGQFHNMAEKMGMTLGGKWAQFMDNVNEKFLVFYKIIEPLVSKILELGSAALDATSNGIGWMVDKLREGNPVAIGLAAVIGVVTTSLVLLKAATMAQALWLGTVTLATNLSTAAWWANNAAMLANPITWIIAGIIALIALIGYLVYKVDGWGEAWGHTVNVVKSLWSGFLNYIKLGWLSSEHILLSGIDKIMIAWYKLKGLWGSEGAETAIEQINEKSRERAREIGATAADLKNDLAAAYASGVKAAGSLSINDKTLGDMGRELKSKLGLGGIDDPSGVPGAGSVNSALGSGSDKDTSKSNQAIATGGTKHNYITINLDSLIRELKIQGRDFKDSSQQMADQSTDALLRVLAMAATAGS